MKWVRTTDISDDLLVHAAANRWLVRVAGGRTATLVRWKGYSGQSARVQFSPDSRATVKVADVLSVQIPETDIERKNDE